MVLQSNGYSKCSFSIPHNHHRLQADGLPLPVSMQMQELGVRLSDAQWTARQSGGGFSLSLFWPTVSSHGRPYPPFFKRPKRRKTHHANEPKKSGPSGIAGDNVLEAACCFSWCHHMSTPPVVDIELQVYKYKPI